VGRIFLRPDASIPASLMTDYEHPTELGYERWAEAIEPTVARLMGDRPRTGALARL
jgi:beta-glucosidase